MANLSSDAAASNNPNAAAIKTNPGFEQFVRILVRVARQNGYGIRPDLLITYEEISEYHAYRSKGLSPSEWIQKHVSEHLEISVLQEWFERHKKNVKWRPGNGEYRAVLVKHPAVIADKNLQAVQDAISMTWPRRTAPKTLKQIRDEIIIECYKTCPEGEVFKTILKKLDAHEDLAREGTLSKWGLQNWWSALGDEYSTNRAKSLFAMVWKRYKKANASS
jgi:predicted transcriptional regulator